MSLLTMPAPTNCLTYYDEQFISAVVASASFRALVGKTTDAEVAEFVFGKRLTHTRSGRVWTREELLELRYFAMVQSEAGGGYGKRLSPFGSYRPYGVKSLWLQRYLPPDSLLDNGAGPQPTDAQEREWQNIHGNVVDEVILFFDSPGPTGTIDNVDWIVDGSSPVEAVDGTGMWQEAEYLFTWSEK